MEGTVLAKGCGKGQVCPPPPPKNNQGPHRRASAGLSSTRPVAGVSLAKALDAQRKSLQPTETIVRLKDGRRFVEQTGRQLNNDGILPPGAVLEARRKEILTRISSSDVLTSDRLIHTHDWMRWFLGTDEPTLIAQKHIFRDGMGDFINTMSGQRWPAGRFDCPSIALLQAGVGSPVGPSGENRREADPCPLIVVDGIDIGTLQGDLTSEQCAMVQVASNFNCLENSGSHVVADYGHLVENYAFDSTQGPAATFGTPAAALLRCHYVFQDLDTPSSQWGQTVDRQVDLLTDVTDFTGHCVNGKLVLSGDEPPVSDLSIDDIASRIRVGIHEDAHVVFRRGNLPDVLEVLPSPPKIDQVLSSSLNWRSLPIVSRAQRKSVRSLTRALLRASYEGAYLAAILRGRKLLLLTLVGGASFENPIDLILEELQRAHSRWASHPKSDLQEVRLVLYEAGVASAIRNRLAGWGKIAASNVDP